MVCVGILKRVRHVVELVALWTFKVCSAGNELPQVNGDISPLSFHMDLHTKAVWLCQTHAAANQHKGRCVDVWRALENSELKQSFQAFPYQISSMVGSLQNSRRKNMFYCRMRTKWSLRERQRHPLLRSAEPCTWMGFCGWEKERDPSVTSVVLRTEMLNMRAVSAEWSQGDDFFPCDHLCWLGRQFGRSHFLCGLWLSDVSATLTLGFCWEASQFMSKQCWRRHSSRTYSNDYFPPEFFAHSALVACPVLHVAVPRVKDP